jgi:hypothetical protein
MKEEKDALDILVDSLLAERTWKFLIERLEKAQAAKPEPRCADRPKSSDRQTRFDQNQKRKGADFLSTLWKASVLGCNPKPWHRPKVAPEPPLPPTMVKAAIDGLEHRFYYTVRSTTDPHLRRADNASAKETAKVEPECGTDTRGDFKFPPHRGNLRPFSERFESGTK